MTNTVEQIKLGDAIDRDLATLACNARPEGWRDADFGDLLAYVHPDCPEIIGEIWVGFEHAIEDVPVGGLVVRPAEGRSWDFRPFGQSPAVRKHRTIRWYLRLNEWKVKAGTLSRREAKKAARRFAERAVADDPAKGCRCAVRMGSRTWLAIL